jgi:hypothetical protein
LRFSETTVHDSLVRETDGRLQLEVNVDQGDEALNAIIDTGATVSGLGKSFMNMMAKETFTLGKQFSGEMLNFLSIDTVHK